MPAPAFQPKPGRALLAMVLVIELLVALVVLAVRPGKLGSSSADASGPRTATTTGPRAVLPTIPPTTAPPPPATVTPPGPGDQLPADQAQVTGTITSVQATGATLGTVSTPFTITASERGFGNSATVNDASINGQPADIEWDAGTPFPLSGGAGFTLAGVLVHVNGDVVTVQLGGGTYPVLPGTYHLASPAAVSTNGLATPVTSVDFTATASTTVTFAGSETLNVPLPLHLTGPGKVVLDGNFTVRTAQGSRSATHVELNNGPYDLKFTSGQPSAQVTAILQGDFAIG